LFDIAPSAFENLTMLELEEARGRILALIRPLPAETVPLDEAAGRVLAEPVISPLDLPLFDNSAMDGYAVRSADLTQATASSPVGLKLAGTVPAGDVSMTQVQQGTCVRIFTGSALPPGADAVVMQEDTKRAGKTEKNVLFLEAVKPWENVRLRGEDVKSGSQLFSVGDNMTMGGLSLLAAVGLKEIKVGRQPVIGLLATGNELREAGEPLAPGKIYESNRVSLAALLKRTGAIPRKFPLVPDTLVATQSALQRALAECDGVVTTGGVSVGELDLVKKAFEGIGGELQFWKVAVKPGKPFVFGRWREKFLFGLPGNPVSALVTFLVLVRPALRRWQGAAKVDLPTHPGILAEPLVNRGDRRHFLRVKVDQSGSVRSSGVQASHILSSLMAANGLVDVPPRTTLEKGTVTQIIRLGDENPSSK
jgi:molybdopterin molybdotransferase